MHNFSPHIVIIGNYGARNLGDEAVLDGILFEIKTHIPRSQITVLSHNPKQTTADHAVMAVPLFPAGLRSFARGIFKFSLLRTLKSIKNAHVVIIGGGTLFADEKIFAVFLWGMHGMIAYLLGKPIYIYANGIGPLRTFIGRKIASFILRKARIVTLRDNTSLIHCKKLTLPQRLIVTADPAFVLKKYSLKKTASIKETKLVRPYIFVNYRSCSKQVKQNLSEIATFLDQVNKSYSLEVELVSFQEYREKDSKNLFKIFAQAKSKTQIHIHAEIYDYSQVISLIRKAQFVIGTRLHSIIFSILEAKPFIAINYTQKVRAILEDLGLDEYIIEPDQLSSEKLMNLFKQVYKKRHEISNQLAMIRQEQEEKAAQNIRKLIDFLAHKR